MNYRQNLLPWALASCLGTCRLLTNGLPAHAGKNLSYDYYHESSKTFKSSSHPEASNDAILGNLNSNSAFPQPFSPGVSSNEASGFEIPSLAKALSNTHHNRNDYSLQPFLFRRPPHGPPLPPPPPPSRPPRRPPRR